MLFTASSRIVSMLRNFISRSFQNFTSCNKTIEINFVFIALILLRKRQ